MEALLEPKITVVETRYSDDEYSTTNVMSDGSEQHYEADSDGNSYPIGTTSAADVRAREMAAMQPDPRIALLGAEMVDGFYGSVYNIPELGKN